MKRVPIPGESVRFADMPGGTFFTDGVFVFLKLAHQLPSGLYARHARFVSEEPHPGPDDTVNWNPRTVPDGEFAGRFNAVGVDGVPASCPYWREFTVVADPFRSPGPPARGA
jgi:hypothetical protein